MTSSPLSLQQTINEYKFAKMKIISFSFTDESRPNLCLPLCRLVSVSSLQINSFLFKVHVSAK